MVEQRAIRIADTTFLVEGVDLFLQESCKDYFVNTDIAKDQPISLSITEGDIAFIHEGFKEFDALCGHDPIEYSETTLQGGALYRALACELEKKDTFFFHASVLAVKGKAYAFSAASGTGKSTHARMWRERYGKAVTMVNDDKPLLRVMPEGGVMAYGNPWCGKHHLGGNISVPLKAICILERGDTNFIQPLSPAQAYPQLYLRCYKMRTERGTQRILELADKLSREVELYQLCCTPTHEAAEVAYQCLVAPEEKNAS